LNNLEQQQGYDKKCYGKGGRRETEVLVGCTGFEILLIYCPQNFISNGKLGWLQLVKRRCYLRGLPINETNVVKN
jgi:hypothetical protein